MASFTIQEKLNVLNNGYCLAEKRLRYSCYNIDYESDNAIELQYNAVYSYRQALKELPELKIARAVNNSLYKRTQRYKERNEATILSGNGLFLTLTFNDETLQNTSYKTRRIYVARYLKSQSDYYTANVDYGDENGREHYHAVIYGKCDYTAWHHLGVINGRPMRSTDLSDVVALSKYITKITSHALKHSTFQKEDGKLYGFPRIIYSKQKLWL